MIKEIVIDQEKKKVKYDITEKSKVLFVCINGGELDLTVNLKLAGSIVDVKGIVFGLKDDAFNVHTVSNHAYPGTRSRVLVKGVFRDKSQFNYEGMIRIEKKAQLTDAYLRNDNLVLGADAMVNSSPQLEILANDVKASHAVTIKDLDKESEHYLESRGLDHKLAQALYTEGFLNEVISQFNNHKKVQRLLKLKR